MGYTIQIGELKIEHVAEAGEMLWLRGDAEPAHHPDAPADGSPTDHTNARWPSYTGWAEFAEDAGLAEYFFARGSGVMSEHPGCYVLGPDDLARLEAVDMERLQPYNRGRMEWLKWWVRWALANCKVPVLANS